MKNNKRSNKVYRFIVICTIILLIISVLLIWLRSKYATMIRQNWDLKLPYNYRESYDLDTGQSFKGDGIRYHIFTYRNSSNLLSSLDWKQKETDLRQNAATQLLEELEVPQEELPDFTQAYLYYYTNTETSPQNEIYLFFFPETNKLYIIELFF